jgi:prophage maintenance system killer protein
LQASKKVFRLSAAYIEAAHDIGLAQTWPGLEPVERLSCRDLNLLASAASSPYVGGFGIEYYPTLEAKAAYLFFHIATSHIFQNGNKRTAVLVLDQFLSANSVYLMISNPAMEKLAESTADYNERGEAREALLKRIQTSIEKQSTKYARIRKFSERDYRELLRFRKAIREDLRNKYGAEPVQARRNGIRMPHDPG